MSTIGDYLRSKGMGIAALEVDRLQSIEEEARAVVHATYSHISGRDLLAELHPRSELDIKRRHDGRETWHEGDWLSSLHKAIGPLRALIFHPLYTTREIERSLEAPTGAFAAGGALSPSPSPQERT